jgi:nucleoid-associated protein YgaU
MIRLETYDVLSGSSPTLCRPGAPNTSPRPGRQRGSSRAARVPKRSLRRKLRQSCAPLALISVGVVVGACGMGHCGVQQPLGVMASSPVAAHENVKPLSVRVIHVRRGDTVWSIAERYGNSSSPMAENVQQLLLSNHLDSSAVIQPGQQLRIAR